MKKFLKSALATVSEVIHVKFIGYRLSFAIFMADQYQRAYNRQYYVLPRRGGLVVLSSRELNEYKKKKYTGRRLHNTDFKRDSFYFTPSSRNNSDGMTRQERADKAPKWLKYYYEYRVKQANQFKHKPLNR